MIKRFLVLIAALGLLAACETASRSNVSGASGASSASAAAADELLSVGDTVFFDYDSSSLSSDAKAVLSAQAAFLAANEAVEITVEGHADERGTREYNLALGERRASAVRDHLVAQGVNDARINTISYGKERPSFIGSNDYAYSKNRRAVSVIK